MWFLTDVFKLIIYNLIQTIPLSSTGWIYRLFSPQPRTCSTAMIKSMDAFRKYYCFWGVWRNSTKNRIVLYVLGTGYQLNLLKEQDCNVARITNIIQKTVPEAEIKSEMGSVLCYKLPSEQTKHFPDLFEILERDKQMLGISSIGVSITTLEEVFLRWVV